MSKQSLTSQSSQASAEYGDMLNLIISQLSQQDNEHDNYDEENNNNEQQHQPLDIDETDARQQVTLELIDKFASYLPSSYMCSYGQGYVTQPIFQCQTCRELNLATLNEKEKVGAMRVLINGPTAFDLGDVDISAPFDPEELFAIDFISIGLCLACGVHCHLQFGHTIVYVGMMNNFRCDCGTLKCPKVNDTPITHNHINPNEALDATGTPYNEAVIFNESSAKLLQQFNGDHQQFFDFLDSSPPTLYVDTLQQQYDWKRSAMQRYALYKEAILTTTRVTQSNNDQLDIQQDMTNNNTTTPTNNTNNNNDIKTNIFHLTPWGLTKYDFLGQFSLITKMLEYYQIINHPYYSIKPHYTTERRELYYYNLIHNIKELLQDPQQLLNGTQHYNINSFDSFDTHSAIYNIATIINKRCEEGDYHIFDFINQLEQQFCLKFVESADTNTDDANTNNNNGNNTTNNQLNNPIFTTPLDSNKITDILTPFILFPNVVNQYPFIFGEQPNDIPIYPTSCNLFPNKRTVNILNHYSERFWQLFDTEFVDRGSRPSKYHILPKHDKHQDGDDTNNENDTVGDVIKQEEDKDEDNEDEEKEDYPSVGLDRFHYHQYNNALCNAMYRDNLSTSAISSSSSSSLSSLLKTNDANDITTTNNTNNTTDNNTNHTTTTTTTDDDIKSVLHMVMELNELPGFVGLTRDEKTNALFLSIVDKTKYSYHPLAKVDNDDEGGVNNNDTDNDDDVDENQKDSKKEKSVHNTATTTNNGINNDNLPIIPQDTSAESILDLFTKFTSFSSHCVNCKKPCYCTTPLWYIDFTLDDDNFMIEFCTLLKELNLSEELSQHIRVKKNKTDQSLDKIQQQQTMGDSEDGDDDEEEGECDEAVDDDDHTLIINTFKSQLGGLRGTALLHDIIKTKHEYQQQHQHQQQQQQSMQNDKYHFMSISFEKVDSYHEMTYQVCELCLVYTPELHPYTNANSAIYPMQVYDEQTSKDNINTIDTTAPTSNQGTHRIMLNHSKVNQLNLDTLDSPYNIVPFTKPADKESHNDDAAASDDDGDYNDNDEDDEKKDKQQHEQQPKIHGLVQLNRNYHECLYIGHLKGTLCNILQFDSKTNTPGDVEENGSNQTGCCLPKQQLEPQLIDLLPSSSSQPSSDENILSLSTIVSTPKTFDVVKSILSNPPSMYSLSNQLDFSHLGQIDVKSRPQFFPSDYYTSCLPANITSPHNTIVHDDSSVGSVDNNHQIAVLPQLQQSSSSTTTTTKNTNTTNINEILFYPQEYNKQYENNTNILSNHPHYQSHCIYNEYALYQQAIPQPPGLSLRNDSSSSLSSDQKMISPISAFPTICAKSCCIQRFSHPRSYMAYFLLSQSCNTPFINLVDYLFNLIESTAPPSRDYNDVHAMAQFLHAEDDVHNDENDKEKEISLELQKELATKVVISRLQISCLPRYGGLLFDYLPQPLRNTLITLNLTVLFPLYFKPDDRMVRNMAKYVRQYHRQQNQYNTNNNDQSNIQYQQQQEDTEEQTPCEPIIFTPTQQYIINYLFNNKFMPLDFNILQKFKFYYNTIDIVQEYLSIQKEEQKRISNLSLLNNSNKTSNKIQISDDNSSSFFESQGNEEYNNYARRKVANGNGSPSITTTTTSNNVVNNNNNNTNSNNDYNATTTLQPRKRIRPNNDNSIDPTTMTEQHHNRIQYGNLSNDQILQQMQQEQQMAVVGQSLMKNTVQVLTDGFRNFIQQQQQHQQEDTPSTLNQKDNYDKNENSCNDDQNQNNTDDNNSNNNNSTTNYDNIVKTYHHNQQQEKTIVGALLQTMTSTKIRNTVIANTTRDMLSLSQQSYADDDDVYDSTYDE